MAVMQNKNSQCIPSSSENMDTLRQDIDAIDRQLVALFNQRACVSQKVGYIKRQENTPILQPLREQSLLERLSQVNKDVQGSLPTEHLVAIYRGILSSSRALQEPSKVAFLGPEGTFSHMACLEYFGDSYELLAHSTLSHVFSAVEKKECNYAIVPIENSQFGTVSETFDLFTTSPVTIADEWISRIRLSLISSEKNLDSITTVYSHAQPLGQCATWLKTNLPRATLVPLDSTALSVERIASEKNSAAIAHASMAGKKGLTILAADIEDLADNKTRFFVIMAEDTPYSTHGEATQSSILFSVANNPGSLSNVLQTLASAGANMSKLESRPMRGEPWKYIFFADVDCDVTAPNFAPVLRILKNYCHSFRVLGAYPAATTKEKAYV